MRKILILLTLLLISCTSKKEVEKHDYIVGITQIVSHPALDEAKKGFIDILEESDIKVKFIENNANGDIAVADLISKNLVLQNVDLIYAIATPTAQAAQNATNTIPIVFSAVTDNVSAKLTNGNITGVLDAVDIEAQVKLMLSIDKGVKKIGYVYNSSEANSVHQLEQLKEVTNKYDLKVVERSITQISEITQVLKVLLEEVDVLYTPADNMVASSIKLIADTAKEYKKISIGAEKAHVDAGILASQGIDYYELGRKAGEMAKDILTKTKDIKEISVSKMENTKVIVNEETKKSIGVEF